MKFYVIYEQNALATMESDIEGPYNSFEKANSRINAFDDSYDVLVVAKIEGKWSWVKEGDYGLFYKPLAEDEAYWLPLAEAHTD